MKCTNLQPPNYQISTVLNTSINPVPGQYHFILGYCAVYQKTQGWFGFLGEKYRLDGFNCPAQRGCSKPLTAAQIIDFTWMSQEFSKWFVNGLQPILINEVY